MSAHKAVLLVLVYSGCEVVKVNDSAFRQSGESDLLLMTRKVLIAETR